MCRLSLHGPAGRLSLHALARAEAVRGIVRCAARDGLDTLPKEHEAAVGAETGDCTDKGRFRRGRPFIERQETEE